MRCQHAELTPVGLVDDVFFVVVVVVVVFVADVADDVLYIPTVSTDSALRNIPQISTYVICVYVVAQCSCLAYLRIKKRTSLNILQLAAVCYDRLV